jgi:hypothetical protein
MISMEMIVDAPSLDVQVPVNTCGKCVQLAAVRLQGHNYSVRSHVFLSRDDLELPRGQEKYENVHQELRILLRIARLS